MNVLAGVRICSACGLSENETEFYDPGKKPARQCKPCTRSRLKRYYAKNKVDWLRRRRETVFGVSDEDLDALLVLQDYSCAVCKESFLEQPRQPHVDHDHETGVVRGLLCGSCNRGLGHFKDDIERMRQAIAYLEGRNY